MDTKSINLYAINSFVLTVVQESFKSCKQRERRKHCAWKISGSSARIPTCSGLHGK